MKKIALMLATLFSLCSFNIGFAQLTEKTIVYGDSVDIKAHEVVTLVTGEPLARAETFYSLVIKKVGVVEADTIWALMPSVDIPMDVDTIQTIIINEQFITEIGDYEIYGWASRFIISNIEGNQWRSGAFSDILLVRVLAAEDIRDPSKWILEFRESE